MESGAVRFEDIHIGGSSTNHLGHNISNTYNTFADGQDSLRTRARKVLQDLACDYDGHRLAVRERVSGTCE